MEVKLTNTNHLSIGGDDFELINPVFFYKGGITHLTIAKMKNKIDSAVKQSHQLHYKVKSIFLELAQNVLSYSKEYNSLDTEERIGLIALDERDQAFIVITRNLISPDNVQALTQHFQLINSLDKAGLFDLKGQIIKENLAEKVSRARVGLIQTAILSENGIQTQFDIVDNQLVYLTVAVKISKHLM